MYHFVKGQGSREYMEDTYVIPDPRGQFFAVFDGHGGSEAAEYCAQRAKDIFFEMLSDHNGGPFEVFKDLFWELQGELVDKAGDSGTTATCIYISDNEVVTANVGDSAAFLWQNNTLMRLTACHRAGSSPRETALVEEAGGVVRNGRVNYALSVTRALGDFPLYPAVQPSPFISQTKISDPEAKIILASDGLWDSIEPTQIPELVADSLDDVVGMAYSLGSACKKSRDNYTVGVISVAPVTGSSYTFTREMAKWTQDELVKTQNGL